MILDEILDHRVGGTETMHQDAFIVSKLREETKGYYQRLENSDSVERWLNDMGDNESCKGILPIAAS